MRPPDVLVEARECAECGLSKGRKMSCVSGNDQRAACELAKQIEEMK